MGKLFIYRGLQASGKSTAALAHVRKNPGTVRVNRDDIRFSIFGAYWGVDEQQVTVIQNAIMTSAMRKGLDVISDNTNLKTRNVRDQMKLAEKWGYEVEFVDFPVSLEVAIERDAVRDKRVGEEVIRDYYARYLRNGFPKIPTPDVRFEFKRYVPDQSLPKAILVDLDGTLAIHDGRSPYDYDLLHTDMLDPHVYETVRMYLDAEYHIIALSGRPDSHDDQTARWLGDMGVAFHELHMRKAGDMRNDAIVKNEIFEREIAPRFNVRLALDDRDRVVEMWRAKGIKTYQVEPGDF